MPAIRKSKCMWEAMAGSDEDALRAEVSLGSDMARELRATLDICSGDQRSSELNEVCQHLSGLLRDKRRTFSCELFRDDSPHAIALPGGSIFVSKSLVQFCGDSEDELAFLIGHEMAHVVRKDVVNKMLSDAAFKLASAAASRFGTFGNVVRTHGVSWLRSAYSRDCELDADELGYRLACRAGYQSSAVFEFLNRLEMLCQNKEVDPGAYFASHPPAKQRTAHLKKIQGSQSDPMR